MRKRPKTTFRTFNAGVDDLGFDFDYNLEETVFLRATLKGKKDVSVEDLRRIALWKIDRVLCVDDLTLRKLSEIATVEPLEHDSILARDLLVRLVNNQGIGFPMASAILKFIRPDVFPIIDVRAYRAWKGRLPNQTTYTVDLYIEYVAWIKSVAAKKKLPLDQVDEQLYCWDRDNNGAISSKASPAHERTSVHSAAG